MDTNGVDPDWHWHYEITLQSGLSVLVDDSGRNPMVLYTNGLLYPPTSQEQEEIKTSQSVR
jgi:hypothetical protein